MTDQFGIEQRRRKPVPPDDGSPDGPEGTLNTASANRSTAGRKTMHKQNVNRIFDTLARSAPKRSIEFQAVTKLSNGAFKVALAADASQTEADISEAIASQTEGLARLVPGSLARKNGIAVGFVKANNVSKPFDANFHMVTASTAADANGKIWSVQNLNGEKRVVLEAGDDLEDIFKARLAARRSFVNPSLASGVAVASVANGDFVRFVDTASGEVGFGTYLNVAGGPTVVDSAGGSHRVDPLQVVSSIPRKQLPAQFQKAVSDYEVTAELSPDKFSTILDYLKKAYGEAAGPMLDRMKQLHSKAA